MFFYYGISEIPENYRIIERKAAKGIVIDGNKILLIFNNHGDYKFPGGGLKSGETFFDALKREMLEECGCVVESIGECLCTTVEQNHDKYEKNSIFKMISEYYICKINNSKHYNTNLDDYEKEQQFESVWINIKDAINNNSKLLDTASDNINPWLKRETDVMKFVYKALFEK